MTKIAMGNFYAKLNSSIKLLRSCALLRFENKFPIQLEDIASKCRGKSYHEIWRLLMSESCFRAILTDYSFFVFSVNAVQRGMNHEIAMSYYGCPFMHMSLEDYIVENYGEDYLIFGSDPSVIEEYEQALSESTPVESPVTFRYDYSPDFYDPGRHPASHLHIGFGNEIRIGCRRILDPLSFTAFIIRHQYPASWKNKAVAEHTALFKSSIRETIELVPDNFLSEVDELEMYLH